VFIQTEKNSILKYNFGKSSIEFFLKKTLPKTIFEQELKINSNLQTKNNHHTAFQKNCKFCQKTGKLCKDYNIDPLAGSLIDFKLQTLVQVVNLKVSNSTNIFYLSSVELFLKAV
jgi:hypothetical protein